MTKILISTQELSTLDISYKAPVSMASHMCLISQVKKASQELSCIPQSIQALHRIGPVKKIIVVGASVSGHDIARDAYLHGADVMMIQRSSTWVVSLEAIRNASKIRYDEGEV
jgi:hypothetical protein